MASNGVRVDHEGDNATNNVGNTNLQGAHHSGNRFRISKNKTTVIAIVAISLAAIVGITVGAIFGLQNRDTSSNQAPQSQVSSAKGSSVESLSTTGKPTSSFQAPASSLLLTSSMMSSFDSLSLSSPLSTSTPLSKLTAGATCSGNAQCEGGICYNDTVTSKEYCCGSGISGCPGAPCDPEANNGAGDCKSPFYCHDQDKVCCGYGKYPNYNCQP